MSPAQAAGVFTTELPGNVFLTNALLRVSLAIRHQTYPETGTRSCCQLQTLGRNEGLVI